MAALEAGQWQWLTGGRLWAAFAPESHAAMSHAVAASGTWVQDIVGFLLAVPTWPALAGMAAVCLPAGHRRRGRGRLFNRL